MIEIPNPPLISVNRQEIQEVSSAYRLLAVSVIFVGKCILYAADVIVLAINRHTNRS